MAMGTVGEGGVRVVNEEVVRLAHVCGHDFGVVEAREKGEAEARASKFRVGRIQIVLEGRNCTGSLKSSTCNGSDSSNSCCAGWLSRKTS